ncbi:hypothetical protein AUR04nite_05040 [Glutamicibacter uratoxydans]|uniref:Uncharacterized protein n=2 Tax=Glutamicibacter uratoxydans TaxID=43667 RepID=A0A4Y4DI99_GLUUR|nr:hypothetical protein AUR04nite_05040 [Glutamicibacter uratoxydans]
MNLTGRTARAAAVEHDLWEVEMGDFRAYTMEERKTYLAPSCQRCGQHRHIVWEKVPDTETYLPRDAGCSNEACTA